MGGLTPPQGITLAALAMPMVGGWGDRHRIRSPQAGLVPPDWERETTGASSLVRAPSLAACLGDQPW